MVPTGRTLYSFPVAYPSLIVRGAACRVQLAAYYEGELVAPTSATYSLLAPGGSALISAASASIVADVATYSIPSGSLPATLEPLGEGWQEEWSLTFAGDSVPYVQRRTAALARCALYPAVNERDFIPLYPNLSVYKSGEITSYQPQITEAWNQILARLIREGRLPYLIRTPDSLREAHLHLALALIFGGFSTEASSEHFRALAEKHEKSYSAAWAGITWQQDSAQSGQVDDPSRRTAPFAALSINGSPHPDAGNGWRGLARRWGV